jgi:hypothetical protein
VHTTLWPGQIWASPTIDFELYAGEDEDDMPLQPADKQIIKDAVFEFMLETNGPPAGFDRWPFMAAAVWNAPVQAQDANGAPMYNPDGTPVLFSAGGFAASTNAGVGAIREDPPGSSALVTPAWVAGFFLGLIGLVEVVRFVVDLIT